MNKLDSTQSDEHRKFEDFVNMAVHELKTPVTVLKAYLQMIAHQLQKENQPGYTKTVEKMEVQLDKLLHLLSDLQDGVKTHSDSIYCLMNDFYINESVRICCESARATHPEFEIEMVVNQSDPLINGDRDRIEQVINNLINNAIKYSGNTKYLKVTSTQQNGQILVSVLDNGIGIPVDKQEYIFQQFYRVEPEKGKYQPGLGLGLFICSEILRKHNGSIGVNSKEGQGSDFWFSLPVKN